MKKLTFFICFIILLFQNVHAQWINSMSIIPAMPTTADQVSLQYDASFPASSCDLLQFTVDIYGNTISVNATHEQGILTVICSNNQTIPIGLLPEGSYTLTLNLFIPGSNTSQSLSFNVTGPVTLNEYTTSGHNFRVFPNPSYDLLQIKVPAFPENDNISIIILNSIGSEVFRSENITEAFIPIDISEFPKGLYFLRILNNQQVLENKTLIFH